MEVVEKVFTYISPDTKSKIQKFGQETYFTFKFLYVIIEILAFSV